MSTAGAVKATSIGAYQLVRKIGEGGMGEVWEAEHQMIGRRAAIKFLLPAFTANASTVERFFNEARAVAALADPGIIQIYDYGREGDQAYIVMELLDGEELSRRMKRLGRLAPLDAVRLAKQIATSLASVHEKGVIHRDLKPDNIFIVGDPAVTGGERPKILDFGIAKLTQHDTQFKTQTGAMVGTPTYMSPEQCRATKIDHRSDIFSLGVMLFVMVTGRPPFEGEGSGDVLISHVRDVPPRPSSIERSVPREVEAIIMRCLEKQPDARYASASELAAALGKAEAFLASNAGFEPTSEVMVTYDPAPILPEQMPGHTREHRRSRWLLVGLAVVVAGASVGVFVASRAKDTPVSRGVIAPPADTVAPPDPTRAPAVATPTPAPTPTTPEPPPTEPTKATPTPVATTKPPKTGGTKTVAPRPKSRPTTTAVSPPATGSATVKPPVTPPVTPPATKTTPTINRGD